MDETTRMRLDLLVVDYQAAREDERNFMSTQAQLLGFCVALLGLLATVLFSKDVQARLPDAVLAAAPLAPLAVIAYTQTTGTRATLRSFYLRACERELRRLVYDLTNTEESTRFSTSSTEKLPILSYTELEVTQNSLSSATSSRYQVITNMITFAIVGIFGGTTLYIALQVDSGWAFLMLGVYGGAALIVGAEMYHATQKGRELFKESQEALDARLAESLEPRARKAKTAGDRSLFSYLILPRPDDLIKSLFFPLAFVVGAIQAPLAWEVILPAAIIWFALEYLIYQARYQLNDIRGLGEDQTHALRVQRARLPIGSSARRAVTASILAAAMRLYLVFVLSFVPGVTGWVLGALTLAVFGVGLFYEMLRSGSTQNAGSGVRSHLIYAVVGFGYAIRGLSGYWMAVRTGEPVELKSYVVLGVFLSLYGSTFVIITWVLDACSYCVEFETRPAVKALNSLRLKPHLLHLLTRSLGYSVSWAPDGGPKGKASTPGARAPALVRRGPVLVVWNLYTVSAAIVAGLWAAQIAEDGISSSESWHMPVAGFTAACVGTVLVLADSMLQRILLSTLATAAIGLVVFVHTDSVGAAFTAALPWLLLSLTVSVMRSQTYYGLKQGVILFQRTMEVLPSIILALIAGPGTARFLEQSERGKGIPRKTNS